MPQGGSVTLASMLFIALVGYWFGIRAGLVAGIAFGLLRMSFGGFILTPIQAVLDYVVAYAALGGLSGIFSGKRFGQYGLYIGYLVGVTGTFLSQYASGVIFFSQYAPEGQHILIFSAVYNLSHNLPEVVITFAILALPNLKYAIDTAAPKGSISFDSNFSRTLQNKRIMYRLPYSVTSASLFVSFFMFPLIHRSERIRINASGWGIATGSSNLFEELSIGGYPLVFVLLLAPAIMFVLTLMDKPTKTLLYTAIFGLLAKLGFIVWAFTATGHNGFLGEAYALTMSNTIIFAIFIGLIFALRAESRREAF